MHSTGEQTRVVRTSSETRCCLCGSTPTDTKHARTPAVGFVIVAALLHGRRLATSALDVQIVLRHAAWRHIVYCKPPGENRECL
jgi:hypothetical protein